MVYNATVRELILILREAASLHRQINQAVRYRLSVEFSLGLGIEGHLLCDQVMLLLVLDGLGALV